MRIPYAPETPADPTPENEAIYERIRARRAPRPLLPLDLALLHNPLVADGYSSLLGAIRTKVSLSQALAELCICYVAVLNDATFEWDAHAPLALKAGASRKALEAVQCDDIRSEDLSEDEQLVLEFTHQSTKRVKVDDEVFEKLKKRFNDQEIMELTITVAGYNMVSRFLVALNVSESNGRVMEMPKE